MDKETLLEEKKQIEEQISRLNGLIDDLEDELELLKMDLKFSERHDDG